MSDWISVDDRLPDDDVIVIAWSHFWKEYLIVKRRRRKYTRKLYWWLAYDDVDTDQFVDDTEINYWMPPLPPPPAAPQDTYNDHPIR